MQLRSEIKLIDKEDSARLLVVDSCRQYSALSDVLRRIEWEDKAGLDGIQDGSTPKLPDLEERESAEGRWLSTAPLPYGQPVWQAPKGSGGNVDCGVWVEQQLDVSLDALSSWPFIEPCNAQINDIVLYYNFRDIAKGQIHHIALVKEVDGQNVRLHSKFGPKHPAYKHGLHSALPWYGSLYVVRRPQLRASMQAQEDYSKGSTSDRTQ